MKTNLILSILVAMLCSCSELTNEASVAKTEDVIKIDPSLIGRYNLHSHSSQGFILNQDNSFELIQFAGGSGHSYVEEHFFGTVDVSDDNQLLYLRPRTIKIVSFELVDDSLSYTFLIPSDSVEIEYKYLSNKFSQLSWQMRFFKVNGYVVMASHRMIEGYLANLEKSDTTADYRNVNYHVFVKERTSEENKLQKGYGDAGESFAKACRLAFEEEDYWELIE
ncbi:MAG: hypothetical protein GYB31_16630 [Bacteroidetes bacterium]|nr:hypothetical protein [Bacteroidota bacterium]